MDDGCNVQSIVSRLSICILERKDLSKYNDQTKVVGGLLTITHARPEQSSIKTCTIHEDYL